MNGYKSCKNKEIKRSNNDGIMETRTPEDN
jgi:hypothetical protein